jgi:transposase-like protein
MAQHFLLSAKARTLDLSEVLGMSEDDARARFTGLVWADTGGAPVCHVCGGLDVTVLQAGCKWTCRGCKTQFTATSGNVFKSHKLSFRKILGVVALFANGVNGVAACRMARELRIAYKTAFVLLHKIRDVMGQDAEAATLGGVVEMDGAVFGGSMPRLPNSKALWDEYKAKNKIAARKRRKLIVVMRERQSDDPDAVARIRTFLLRKEGDAVEIARQIVRPGTVVHADGNTQWEPLHLDFETKRINHSEHFSKDGACTNQAESFFGRMRTAERGVHRHISGAHMARYAMELGWREQYRRKSNGDQFEMIITSSGRAKPSEAFKGYWRKRAANDTDDVIRALTG